MEEYVHLLSWDLRIGGHEAKEEGMKGCGEWRRTFQAEETAGEGERSGVWGRCGWVGPVDRSAGFRAALEQPLVLRIRGWVPSHWNRRREKRRQK